MRSRIAPWLTALTAITVLAIPGRAAAQRQQDTQYPYMLIDVGTFGGPQSGVSFFAPILNHRGVLGGLADTSLPNPNYPNVNPAPPYSDRFVAHAFLWQKGVLTNLGALPGNYNNSAVFAVNEQGDAVGVSENGVTDPLQRYPEADAVLWKDGRIINLGTLGGYESFASDVNDRGQVAGFAANATPDSFTLAPSNSFTTWGTQTRAFVWQGGQLHDLGTLGGPDTAALYNNSRGQITGASFTTTTANAVTGIPTEDPFLWQDGTMRDLGTLGGTVGFPNDLNNRGEVVGQSNLAGDQTFHPFLWDGRSMRDLGTLGGNNGFAAWMNEDGDVVGRADMPGSQAHHAFLWKDGVMTDLGTIDGYTCSTAFGINSQDQVVGTSSPCGRPGHAFLWEHGSITDVNTLVAPSPLQITEAQSINDRGEISCYAKLPNGDQHVVLLIPTREAESDGLTTGAPTTQAPVSPALAAVTQGTRHAARAKRGA